MTEMFQWPKCLSEKTARWQKIFQLKLSINACMYNMVDESGKISRKHRISHQKQKVTAETLATNSQDLAIFFRNKMGFKSHLLYGTVGMWTNMNDSQIQAGFIVQTYFTCHFQSTQMWKRPAKIWRNTLNYWITCKGILFPDFEKK